MRPRGLSRWPHRPVLRRLLNLLGCVLVSYAISGGPVAIATAEAQADPGPPQADYVPQLGLHVLRRTVSPASPRSVTGQASGQRRTAAEPGWPMRGGDPANTGHTQALGPVVQTETAWSFSPGGGAFVWRPAVAPDGTIYVTTVAFTPDGVDGRLYALHPDGSVKWQTELTNSSGLKVWASATPALDDDGNIYIAWAHDIDFQRLTAISLDRNGSIRWRFEPTIALEFASHQEPVLAGGVLYATADTSFVPGDPSHRASIFALDRTTGRALWRWESPNQDTFFAGPAVGPDGHLYHASASNELRAASGYLYRIRPNGVLDWSVDIGIGVNAPPAVDGQNSVYLGDLAGIASKHGIAGTRLWTYDTRSGQIFASPMLRAGRVAVGGASAGLHVLDATTGERAGLFAPGSFPMSQASDRAGNTFFYSLDGTGSVFAFGRGGRQWWRFPTGVGVSVNAVAIAAGGTVLVSNTETLTAYIAPVLGDMNCDGVVNVFDVDPFVLALTDPTRYARRHPRCHRFLADVDGNGAVNALDLAPFLQLIR